MNKYENFLQPSSRQIAEFIESHELVIKPSKTAYGEVYALVSGDINYACPYDSMMLKEALRWANERHYSNIGEGEENV